MNELLWWIFTIFKICVFIVIVSYAIVFITGYIEKKKELSWRKTTDGKKNSLSIDSNSECTNLQINTDDYTEEKSLEHEDSFFNISHNDEKIIKQEDSNSYFNKITIWDTLGAIFEFCGNLLIILGQMFQVVGLVGMIFGIIILILGLILLILAPFSPFIIIKLLLA